MLLGAAAGKLYLMLLIALDLHLIDYLHVRACEPQLTCEQIILKSIVFILVLSCVGGRVLFTEQLSFGSVTAINKRSHSK